MRLGVYDQLRYSRLYEAILRYRNPGYIAHLRADLAFYSHLFNHRRLRIIVDVGANVGDKAAVFAQLADRVICIEPDPRALAALRTRFRKCPRIHILAQAMGATSGRFDLLRQADASAYNSLSSKHAQLHQIDEARRVSVDVRTVDSVIAKYGVPDFLKVDVEGFETEVFAGLTQSIPLLCFEANLPEFQEETLTVIGRLQSIQPYYRFNAVTNDNSRTWAFPTWETADGIRNHVLSTRQGSMDIYATAKVGA